MHGFPGLVLDVGCPDSVAVRRLQRRLNAVGCGPLPEDGVFDRERTAPAVRLFQARATDVGGVALRIDGRVGMLTWGALFGPDSVPSVLAPPPGLLAAVVDVALGRVGQTGPEEASAASPRVIEGPASGGSAFTWQCFEAAAARLGQPNPHGRAMGVLDHWRCGAHEAGARRVRAPQARDDPSLVRPGAVFVIDAGGGLGHTGIVVENRGGCLATVEALPQRIPGNTPRCVVRRMERRIAQVNRGFLDYGLD